MISKTSPSRTGISPAELLSLLALFAALSCLWAWSRVRRFLNKTNPRPRPRRADTTALPLRAGVAAFQAGEQNSLSFVIRLAGVLALLTALGAALIPHVAHAATSRSEALLLAGLWAAAASLVLGYGCRLLDAVLANAVRGGLNGIRLPDFHPVRAFASLASWTLSFAAGPAFLIYPGIYLWIESGKRAAIDGLVIAVLTALAVSYWIAARLVQTERPELVCASPALVLRALRRLRGRALLTGVGITAAAACYAWLGSRAVALLQGSQTGGLLLLWLCWYSAWECAAFTLRIAGFWYHRHRPVVDQPAPPASPRRTSGMFDRCHP